MSNVFLEVCCGDILSVRGANAGGANRIELCSALDVGGITPSAALILKAVEVSDIPVNVLIRPRPGDFLYDADELAIMIDDIHIAIQSGANGVVIGALDADGDIDTEAMARMIEAANGHEVTLHRAFDLCRDPMHAMETAIRLGCKRILTSGCAQTARDGASMLRKLVEESAGRISIMAGAGINEDNAAEIVSLTGVKEIHGSLRSPVPSQMRWQPKGVSMGAEGANEYEIMVTSATRVKRLLNINP